MASRAPGIYLWHGEDEYAISREVKNLLDGMGDPTTTEINTARLDGRTTSLEELETALFTLPFLAARRMVILVNPLARLTSPTTQESFKKLVEKTPPTVTLVLIEYKTLAGKKEKDKDKEKELQLWFRKWAMEHSDFVDFRNFQLPYPNKMPERIRQIANDSGVQITPDAIELLASLVGSEPRIAYQELQKLLAYVNYQRPIVREDVELVVADQGHGNIFNLVDAIGERNGRKAADLLHRLQEVQETVMIFGMVVRQFRLLIQAREVMDKGGSKDDFARQARQSLYVAEKVYPQARRFTLPVLESIYHRLSDLDEDMKTGGMEGDLALETFVSEVTR